jgi:nitric oxide synthase oxygenase domain/subunit
MWSLSRNMFLPCGVGIRDALNTPSVMEAVRQHVHLGVSKSTNRPSIQIFPSSHHLRWRSPLL